MMNGTDNGLPMVNRARVWIFLIVLLVICASMGSCSGKGSGGVPFEVDAPDGGQPYQMVSIEAEDAHLEIPNLAGPVPAFTYWVANGDGVAPVFKTFELHWQRKGKMCDFLDNTNSADCFVCDLCNQSDQFCKDAYEESFKGGVGTGFLEVWQYASFMPGEVKQTVFSFAESHNDSKLRSACQLQAHTTFTPESNGLYRITFPEQMFLSEMRTAVRGVAEGTAKIFVVSPTSKYATFYQLTAHSEGVQVPNQCGTPSPTPTPPSNPSCPGCAWLKLPAPLTTNGYREDSFSPHVRITEVAVLKGTPAVDANTGRFKLDETSSLYVHPSRVVMVPSANDGDSVLARDNIRCYTDASETGGLDLRTCRRTRNVDCAAPDCVLNATPQYLHDSATEPLTWFVEFNPAEGGIVPTLNCGEVLAIKFTLERV